LVDLRGKEVKIVDLGEKKVILEVIWQKEAVLVGREVK